VSSEEDGRRPKIFFDHIFLIAPHQSLPTSSRGSKSHSAIKRQAADIARRERESVDYSLPRRRIVIALLRRLAVLTTFEDFLRLCSSA